MARFASMAALAGLIACGGGSDPAGAAVPEAPPAAPPAIAPAPPVPPVPPVPLLLSQPTTAIAAAKITLISTLKFI